MMAQIRAENKLSRSKAYRWVNDRFKIDSLVDYMSHKVVPLHGHSIFYYFGGISLFLFIVQVVTGILLLDVLSAGRRIGL